MSPRSGSGPVLRADAPTDRSAAIVEAALDCIVTIDETGRVVEFNPASEQLFGWTRHEALGQDLSDLFVPAEYADAHRAGIAHYLATGEGPALRRRLELPAVRRDGTPLVVELVAVPLLHEGRREFTGFIRDITELRRTQELLRASQARYEAIVRHSNAALVLCEPDGTGGTVVAGEAMLGYEVGLPLDGGFLAVVHRQDRARARRFLHELGVGGRGPGSSAELRLRRSDGRHVLCEVTGEDLSALPEVAGLLVRATDVTEDREHRRRLDDATAQMRTLIDNLGSAVLLEDDTRHVLVANDRLVDLFRIPVPADELVGADCSSAVEAVAPLFADPEGFVAGVDRTVAEGSPVLGEQLSMADDRTLERDYLPIESDGRAAGHLWVYRDITQHIAEREMLTDQNRSLAELAALKNEFVARVSHELRSPLTSVVSFSELLGDESSGPLTAEQTTFLEIVLRNAHRLLRLIEDLLLMAKLESHTLPLALDLVDPAELAAQVTAELAPSARAKGVTLGMTRLGSHRVRGDAVRLQQVLSNLVGNAIAYTQAGGDVQVCTEVDEEASELVVTVADTGVGIGEDELDAVFTAFFRASTAAAAGAAGTGLGLAIVRLIVEQHGGSISARSRPGVGTTMTVRLPCEVG